MEKILMNRKLFLITLLISLTLIGLLINRIIFRGSPGYYIDNGKIKPKYTINHVYRYSSSGGDRCWDINYGVQNERFISCDGSYRFEGTSGGTKIKKCTVEILVKDKYPFNIQKTMNDVLEELKSYNLSNAILIKLKDRNCFYKIRNRWGCDDILVCFNQEKSIVNYATDCGGRRLYWNVGGYNFTQRILDLL